MAFMYFWTCSLIRAFVAFFQSTEGAVVESWEGVRVQAVCTHPTSKEAIVADSHHRVKSYNFQEPKVTPL